MDTIFWIIVAILLIAVILAAIALYVNRKRKVKPDYYGLFVIGLFWVVIGVPLNNLALIVLGAIFFVTGLVNNRHWKENRKNWKKLKKKHMIIISVIAIVSFLLLVIGLVAYYIVQNGIV
jgi:membrane protein insertase Oxa1/YidC/SpoIIIJ